jgi:hypothetical protein
MFFNGAYIFYWKQCANCFSTKLWNVLLLLMLKSSFVFHSPPELGQAWTQTSFDFEYGSFETNCTTVLCVSNRLTQWIQFLLRSCQLLSYIRISKHFFASWKFITMIRRARHWSLSWARSIQPIAPQSIYLRTTFILPSHLHLGIPNGLFPSAFLTKTLYAFLFSPSVLYALPILSNLTWSL